MRLELADPSCFACLKNVVLNPYMLFNAVTEALEQLIVKSF